MAADTWEGVKAHLKQYQDDPDAGHAWNPYGKEVTALLLTAKGRKSGKLRTRPLIYKQVGDVYVIVASMGGADVNPAWYENLMATPECEIQVAREVIPVRARRAEGEERARLWEEMVELLPQYAEYQTRTSREIPVVVLERRTAAS